MNARLLGAALAAAFAALLFLRPHAAQPASPMRDFEAYYAAGAAANAGADPYSTALWTYERPLDRAVRPFQLLPFVSPPWVIPGFRILALIPFGLANAIWRFMLLCGIAALAACMLRACRLPFTAPAWMCAVALAVGFGPLLSAFALGQLALLAFACAAAAFAWPPAAIGAWLQPNVALVLFSRPPRMALIWALAGALIFTIVLNAGYVQTLALHGLSERFSAIQITSESILYGFGAPETAAAAGAFAIAAGALVFWMIQMRVVASPYVRFAAGCALLPLGMPFFHEHDFIVTFVPAVLVCVLCPARIWPVAVTASLLCASDWLGMAERPGAIAQTALLGGTFFCAAAAARGDLTSKHLALGAGLYALFFVPAALIAAHDILPIWPDAMHQLTQTRFANAAAAWHAEQAASGFFARNAGWSALRALPLGGSLLLALLLARHVDVHHVVERSDAVGMKVA